MMLLATLAAAAIYGTNFPDSFRGGEVSKYVRCMRNEVNEANEPFPEVSPETPTVTQFSQRIAYCKAERLRATATLTGLIKQRNPDWALEKLARSAEFVLAGLELEMITQERIPVFATHDGPPQEF